jgi:hypothetical protein
MVEEGEQVQSPQDHSIHREAGLVQGPAINKIVDSQIAAAATKEQINPQDHQCPHHHRDRGSAHQKTRENLTAEEAKEIQREIRSKTEIGETSVVAKVEETKGALALSVWRTETKLKGRGQRGAFSADRCPQTAATGTKLFNYLLTQ